MSSASRQRMERWAFALVLTAMFAAPALAQNRPGYGRGQNYQNLPEFKAKGKVKALAPGMMQVEVSDKESWVVQVLPNNRGVRYVGSAEPNWLMPGMWVNFTTRFNQKGQALEPVKLLMVFTPGNTRRDEGQLQPGVKPLTNPGADVSFSGEEKAKPKDDTALCEVTGQIQGLGKGSIAVMAGTVPVQVTLAEAASISVDVADLSPIQVGDSVEVDGRVVAPGQGIGTRVEVSGATPLSNKVPQSEGKTKVTAKETKDPAPSTESKTPPTGEKKLPLLGKKPTSTEK